MTHWVGEEKWVEVIGVKWGAGGGALEKDGAVVDGNESGTVKTFFFSLKGIDSEPHKTAYVYVKYHHKFIPGTRECISGLLRKIFVFKVGKPSFFPASE